METGTTAVHVSPGTEEAMKVAEAFKSMASQAANAIVDASQLKQDMAELRKSFEELKHDLDYVRSRNQELDRNLSDVRRQRDEAEQKLSQAQSELTSVNRDLSVSRTDYEGIQIQLGAFKTELEHTRKERDDYGMEAMKLREELDIAKGKLAEIEHFAASLFPMKQEAPKPSPVPEPSPMPANLEPQARIYESDIGYSWAKEHYYDNDKAKWFNPV